MDYPPLAYLCRDRSHISIIRGSGGLRKIRWHAVGVGKRGGLRVIYYWAGDQELILLLLAYEKTDQDDLSAEQVRVLGRLVKEEFG